MTPLHLSPHTPNQFKSWFIYLMLPCFLFAAVFWITRLNKVRGWRWLAVVVEDDGKTEARPARAAVARAATAARQTAAPSKRHRSNHPTYPQGLMMFPAMVIVPTLQIAWTLSSILSGMLYFKEYRDFGSLGASMFFLGLLVCWAC